jgi:5'-nucleotidase
MAKGIENIALFDMDGTLCDYEGGLVSELEKLRSPNEQIICDPLRHDAPDYLKERMNVIRKSREWWANLPKLKIGFEILQEAKRLDYRIMILTQGPRKNPDAWSGKKVWIDKNLGEDVEVTMTRDKGLVYGKVLVDDYPEYIERWLEWRPRGAVIMPANDANKNFKHPQVTRYDGNNLEEISYILEKSKIRE